MQLDIFYEAATQISVMHLKSTKHFIWFNPFIFILALAVKWSTGQKEWLDHPFQFHFDLNTNYFKV